MGHTLAAGTPHLFPMASKALERCKTLAIICKTKIFYVFHPMWTALLYIYFGPFKLFPLLEDAYLLVRKRMAQSPLDLDTRVTACAC